MKRHLVIGNGGAAFNAMQAIRSLQTEDEVTVISREDLPAYSPMLTPYYIADNISYSSMFLCQHSFYKKHNINAILGRIIVDIQLGNQQVYLDDGQILKYDELLIATGSSPTLPSIPGREWGLTLWTVRDAWRLKAAMGRTSSVAVVGAGLIGIQIVDTLLKLNKKVILIEIKERVLPRVLDKEGAAIIAGKLIEKGVDIYLSTQVHGITKRKGKRVLTVDTGAELEADMVVFAVGVRPNTDFLTGTGIRVDKGVMVDEIGQTNIEHVFAAGDVAQAVDPASGRSDVNATWSNAIHSGWAAGCSMAGKRFIQRQRSRVNALSPAGVPVVSLGVVEPAAEDEVIIQRSKNCYRKLVFSSDHLIGAVLIGEVEDAGILSCVIEDKRLLRGLKKDLNLNSAFHSMVKSRMFSEIQSDSRRQLCPQ